MTSLKFPLRRTAALLAGAFIGVAGAAAGAAPASATSKQLVPVPEVTLTGTAQCASSGVGWTVDWRITNAARLRVARVNATTYLPAGSTATGILPGDRIPSADREGLGELRGRQIINQPGTSARLTVDVEWMGVFGHPVPHPQTARVTATVAIPAGCTPPTSPSPSNPVPSSSAPSSPAPSSPAPSSPAPSSPAPSSPAPSSPAPSSPAPSSPAPSSPAPSSPAPSSPAPSSPGPRPTGSPAPQPEIGNPTPLLEFTCDAMIIGLDNPDDGIEIPLVFTPSTGEPRELVVKPGERKTVTFPASEGFTLKAAVKGFESEAETIPWSAPEGCDGSGGGLPVTGVSVGGIAGGAGVLLAAGAALFYVSRRRGVKFTA